jgi:translation elongation factor P/translation initiation factor 5A
MTLLDRIEDAYHNGGGLNLSADDVRELMDWLEDEETVTFVSSEGDTFEVELPDVKRSH